MPPPPPSKEACERSWELYALYGWRDVAEILKKEGYPCGSHETARQWGMKGEKLYKAREALNVPLQQARRLDGLEQDMAALRHAVNVGEFTILEVMPHLKWLYREMARLVGTDAPTQTSLSVSGVGIPTPDPEVEVQLEQAARRAEADIAVLRGGQP